MNSGKALLIPLCVLIACLLAAALGALQNQLTYPVSPSWFHDWKFSQFDIPPALHGRVGASLVGLLATWWLGLILGLVLLIPCLFQPTARRMFSAFLKAALFVLAATLMAEIAAALWGLARINSETAPGWTRVFDDPAAAARVQFINFIGYLAAACATIAAAACSFLRRNH